MGAVSADEIRGYEYDWLGSDVDGHVALFSTAGGGYAPGEFLRDIDAHYGAINAVLESPATTKARFAPELRLDLVNTWRLAAERGLFAFDSDVHGGPYRLVAAPEVPVCVARLPSIAVDVAHRLNLPHLRFAALSVISEDNLRDSG